MKMHPTVAALSNDRDEINGICIMDAQVYRLLLSLLRQQFHWEEWSLQKFILYIFFSFSPPSPYHFECTRYWLCVLLCVLRAHAPCPVHIVFASNMRCTKLQPVKCTASFVLQFSFAQMIARFDYATAMQWKSCYIHDGKNETYALASHISPAPTPEQRTENDARMKRKRKILNDKTQSRQPFVALRPNGKHIKVFAFISN